MLRAAGRNGVTEDLPTTLLGAVGGYRASNNLSARSALLAWRMVVSVRSILTPRNIGFDCDVALNAVFGAQKNLGYL
jgi:hypothetical protein